MQNTKITDGDSLPNEVKINLNVLGVLMLHRVGGHVDDTDVITVDQCGAPKRGMQLRRSWRSQVASATPLATARYSASALYLDTVFWRLEESTVFFIVARQLGSARALRKVFDTGERSTTW